MKKLIFAIASVCLLLASGTPALAESYPKTTENGKEYYLYKVHKSEGFYSIGKRFKISREEIVRYNPETAEGIKLGQVLKIPVNNDNKSLTFQEAEDGYSQLPDYEIEDSGRTHRVKAKETLYGISNRYDVSVDDILALNPQAVKLEAGMVLRVPRKIKRDRTETALESRRLQNEQEKAAVEFARQTEATVPDTAGVPDPQSPFVVDETDIAGVFTEAADEIGKHGLNSLRVAIMMPFSLDSLNRDNNMNHFVDFYRGCLIAADSLVNNGMDITIDAYDIGKTAMELSTVLANPDLKKSDIIIGPAYSSQIYYVADYAKTHGIRLVVPFTNNVKEINDNKYIFQILCPQKQLFDKVSDYYAGQWSGKTVMIVKPDTIGITYNKRDFTDLLIPKLQSRSIPVTYIPETGLPDCVDSLAAVIDTAGTSSAGIYARQPQKEIVLIIPTSNRPKLMELSEHLTRINNKGVTVFAFPEWDGYQLKELYVKPVQTFNSYKPDPINEETVNFFAIYNKKFGKPVKQTRPSFALIGYDIMMYFSEQWQQNGKGMEQGLESGTKTQLSFDFERQGNGGYINKGVFHDLFGMEGIIQSN